MFKDVSWVSQRFSRDIRSTPGGLTDFPEDSDVCQEVSRHSRGFQAIPVISMGFGSVSGYFNEFQGILLDLKRFEGCSRESPECSRGCSREFQRVPDVRSADFRAFQKFIIGSSGFRSIDFSGVPGVSPCARGFEGCSKRFQGRLREFHEVLGVFQRVSEGSRAFQSAFRRIPGVLQGVPEGLFIYHHHLQH